MSDSSVSDSLGPRSPVTRVQVDAYRFGLRRMDAALVGRDPIPLHEELRGQRRAVVIGLVLAMIGLAGAAILARLDVGTDRPADQVAPAYSWPTAR